MNDSVLSANATIKTEPLTSGLIQMVANGYSPGAQRGLPSAAVVVVLLSLSIVVSAGMIDAVIVVNSAVVSPDMIDAVIVVGSLVVSLTTEVRSVVVSSTVLIRSAEV